MTTREETDKGLTPIERVRLELHLSNEYRQAAEFDADDVEELLKAHDAIAVSIAPRLIGPEQRDGKRILIFIPDDDLPGEREAASEGGWHTSYFDVVQNQWICGGEIWSDEAFHVDADKPTHRMPVPPDPPKDAKP